MDPKSYQLQHFTRNFETLKLILKEGGGFWPRYSLEDFSWSHPNGLPQYLAIPCTCFCDLPFEANAMHRADYGDYVIAFDKASELANHLTPLVYVNETGPLAEMIRNKYSRFLSRFDGVETVPNERIHHRPTLLNKDELDGLWEFLPYLKSTLGHTLQPCLKPTPQYSHQWMTKYLEEEFEWRYVPPKHRNSLYCFDDYDCWSMEKLGGLSQATRDSFLKFSKDEVEAIIVTSNAEKSELVGIHPDLTGKVKTWIEIPGADGNAG